MGNLEDLIDEYAMDMNNYAEDEEKVEITNYDKYKTYMHNYYKKYYQEHKEEYKQRRKKMKAQ